MHRRRGLLALLTLVLFVALAMAPIGAGWHVAELIPVPLLFGAVVSAPVPRVDTPERLPSLPVPAPPALRAPPIV